MRRTLGEMILGLVPRSSIDPNLGQTPKYDLANALDFLRKTVPDFPERLRGKDVLDYGCGHGWQCCAIAKLNTIRSITGLDIRLFEAMAENARNAGVQDIVNFVRDPGDRQYDVVYSSSSFEHFDEPEHQLRRMIDLTRPGGEVIVSFAEPWYSPNGSHLTGYTGLPWSNLLFSERTLMKVRSRYRTDGATRYADIEGGLNKMTVRRFERAVRNAPHCAIEHLAFLGVKRLPLVTSIPFIREFATSAACCILRRQT